MDSPIFTSAQMRDAEEAAFARGVKVETLMDRAGAGVARAITKFFPQPGKCIVFAGKGHNAGDGLVEVAGRRIVVLGGAHVEMEPLAPFDAVQGDPGDGGDGRLDAHGSE